MVGVGGRSKACDNCRRRRIKCDLGQPACYRCIKARLKCGGSRGIAVIQYKGRNTKEEVPEPQSTEEAIRDLVSLRRQQWTPRISETEPRLGIALTIPHEELFVNYASAHLVFPGDKLIMEPGMKSSLTSKTFLALATAFFGTKHGDGTLVRQGLHGYSKALMTVNEALGNPKLYPTFDLLQSVVIMSMFEYLISNKEQDWIKHARGLERLLELRGPQTFTSLPELVILERNRPSNIFAAILLRQPTILARPEWKTIPWSVHAERKTDLQLLYDLFADVPEILVTKYQLGLQHVRKSHRSMYRRLAARVLILSTRMEQLHQTWETKHLNCHHEVPSPANTPAMPGQKGESVPLWSTVLHYESLYHANFTTGYNAMRILLLQLFQDSSMSQSMTSEQMEQISTKVSTSGMSICRSIDYYLDEIKKGAFSYLLLFPIQMALSSVGQTNPAIGFWLEGNLDQLNFGLLGRRSSGKTDLQASP